MEKADIVAALKDNSIFSDLDDEELDFLAGAAVTEHMEPGHVVFRHGERARYFYLILSGEIAIEIPAIEGPTLFLQHLKRGQVLGWSWLIPPYQWSFMARTEQPVDVIRFDGATVLKRCESDAEFGYHLLRAFSAMMSERLGHARRRIMDEWQAKGFG
ncbi:MAG: cyclic nucleotide-binding domain-containing protein [Gammaproteobacteria bacterium]